MDPELQDWLQGRLRVVKVTAHRTRPWARIWRIETRNGLWWLKENAAGSAHEPALLACLARLGLPLVPESISHPDRPWSLIADAGRPAHETLSGLGRDAVVRFWSELLADYGELQRRTSESDLLAAGVPDFRPSTLSERFAELLAAPEWLGPPAAELDQDGRRRLRALAPLIASASAELAGGLPSTVQHDDLHEDNVLLSDGDLRRPRLIDWGDAVVAHPFCTLRLTLDTLREELPSPDVERDIETITSAYLEGWRTGGVGEAELRRQVGLARWLECASRAACWIRSLGSLQVGLEQGYAGAPAGWLERMADEADRIAVG